VTSSSTTAITAPSGSPRRHRYDRRAMYGAADRAGALATIAGNLNTSAIKLTLEEDRNRNRKEKRTDQKNRLHKIID
jgi:hypothetical protein